MVHYEQKILDAVDARRDELISFVQKMVQIPSVTLDEAAIGEAFYEGMQKLGLQDVQLIEEEPGHPNIIARVKGDAGGPSLIFNGHLDVIPPGPEEDWIYPSTSGKIVDGKMYGRGTVDMKSGTCGSVLAAAIVKDLGIPLKGDVQLTVVCDEEICGSRGVIYLLKKGYIKKNHPDDMGINCEPTRKGDQQRLWIANKGILRAHFIVHGKNAHGSRPYLGINAITKAVKVIEEVEALEKRIQAEVQPHPLLEPPVILVAMVSGGSAMNMVPDTCRVSVTRRLLPSETKEKAIQDYQDIIAKLSAADPEFKAELDVYPNYRLPMDLDPNEPIIEILQRAYERIKGVRLPLAGEEGGADAAFVIDATGIPMPIYGPGDIKLAAAIDECVELEDIITAIKVYALSIYYALGKDA